MKLPRAAIALFCSIAAVAGIWWLSSSGAVRTLNASVDGRVITVAAKIPGYVEEVAVRPGDAVHKGQILFRLDRAEYDLAVSEAKSELAKIAASLPPQVLVPHPDKAPAPSGISLAQARAEENALRKAVEAASETQARSGVALAMLRQNTPPGDPKGDLRAALQADAAAKAALEKARAGFEKASYLRATLEAEERRSRAAGQIPAQLAAQLAAYDAQRARVRQTEENLAATVVVSPQSGRVLDVGVQDGQTVAAGSPGVGILPDGENGLWITADFAPEQASRLNIGQECDIVLPGRNNLALKGRLVSMQPGGQDRNNATARIAFAQYGDALPPALAPGEAARVTFTVRPAAKTQLSAVNATIATPKQTPETEKVPNAETKGR